jgi:hypothetical protein
VEAITADANRELENHHRVDMPQLLKCILFLIPSSFILCHYHFVIHLSLFTMPFTARQIAFELLELERLDLLEEKLKEYAALQLEMINPLVNMNDLFQKNVNNLNVSQQMQEFCTSVVRENGQTPPIMYHKLGLPSSSLQLDKYDPELSSLLALDVNKAITAASR